jgi:membrane-associated phospholipid phosphatase
LLTWEALAFYGVQSTFVVLGGFVLLRLMFADMKPLATLVHGLRALPRSVTGRRGVFLVLLTAVAGYALNDLDPWFTRLAVKLHGIEDFSVYIMRVEGGATAHLQAWAPKPVIVFFLFVYVSLLFALYGATTLGLFHLRDAVLLRASAPALVLNYVLALPFFWFVSVRETWYAAPTQGATKARLLIDDLSPLLESLFRTARGIENNFPSLHTSVAATAALLAWRSGQRRFATVATVAAALVAFSTLYLGFHWVTDMLGGAIHALVCTALAVRWARRSSRGHEARNGVTAR